MKKEWLQLAQRIVVERIVGSLESTVMGIAHEGAERAEGIVC